MPDLPAEVRDLGRNEWRLLRTARLRALNDSPGAYLSTHDEAGDGEDEWRRRFVGADWVVATDRGLVVGLAGLVSTPMEGGARYIEWVWVAPGYRQRGVLRALIARLTEIGHAKRLDALWLWVVGNNHIALRAYSRLGFERTGREQMLGSGSATRVERQLRLHVS